MPHRTRREKKTELERIIEYRRKGAILRARCQWHNVGEKNSKHSLTLEKRHFNSGVNSQIKPGDSSFFSTDKEILNECKYFYKNLYSSHTDAQHVEDSNFFSKTQPEKEDCEGVLTKPECLQAVKNMKPEKTPGTDGLPVDFYKVFWNEISDFFLNSIIMLSENDNCQ